jgi:hypothetical protein
VKKRSQPGGPRPGAGGGGSRYTLFRRIGSCWRGKVGDGVWRKAQDGACGTRPGVPGAHMIAAVEFYSL